MNDSVLVKVARFRYPLLIAVAVLQMAGHIGYVGLDAVWFTSGRFDLHIYAQHPEVQIGPLSLLVARLLGPIATKWLIAAVGIACIWVVERIALERTERPDLVRMGVLAGGFAVVSLWDQMIELGHIDDALAVLFGCLALWALYRRSIFCGVALGLAIVAKPWAVVLLPMAFGVSGAIWFALGVSLLGWGPFIIGDPQTLTAAKFAIRVADDSGLRLLGWDGERAPEWLRAVQLSVGMVLAGVCALRKRWDVLMVVGFTTRLATDAGTFGYYGASLLVALLAWDLLNDRLPIATVVGFLVLKDPAFIITKLGVRAPVLFLFLAGLIVTVCKPTGSSLVPKLRSRRKPLELA